VGAFLKIAAFHSPATDLNSKVSSGMCTEEGSKARGKWGIPGGTPDDDGNGTGRQTLRQMQVELLGTSVKNVNLLRSEKFFAASVCMQSFFSMPNQVPAFCKQ